jgi:hypothetical protein
LGAKPVIVILVRILLTGIMRSAKNLLVSQQANVLKIWWVKRHGKPHKAVPNQPLRKHLPQLQNLAQHQIVKELNNA